MFICSFATMEVTSKLQVSPSTENILPGLRELLQAPIDEPAIATTNHSHVFKTPSKIFRKFIAVKIIHRNALPLFIADKFLPRELDITNKVRHPHLARTLCVMTPTPNKIVIVMDFYPNGTLLNLVRKEQRIKELPQGIRLFRQLIEAVHYLHEREIAHRDIKLENILLDVNGDVKLADFGFARHIKKRERTRSFCGTRPYSSPQLAQLRPYDAYAADWYAVGVVLYTILYGRWPAENVPGTAPVLNFPDNGPSPACRRLIASLLEEDETQRFGYHDCVNSEWMAAQSSWIFAGQNFVYEQIKPPKLPTLVVE